MPRRDTIVAWLALSGLALLLPSGTAAQDEDLKQRVEGLEERLRELESERAVDPAPSADEPVSEPTLADSAQRSLAEWARYVRVSGSANTGYYYGQTDSVMSDRDFRAWDARLFVDAELGGDVRLGDAVLVRNAGFSFEWNIARIGSLQNDLGELYIELQGLGDSAAANLQLGRFQIPVGEAYLRYSRGVSDKPFITDPVGGPWYWDEGVKLYGATRNAKFGYVASVTDGEESWGAAESDPNPDKQVSLRLYADPAPWLHVSVSGLRSGRLGSNSTAASGSLWLGETWARAFGAGSGVPNVVDGAVAADGPNQIRDTWLGAADVIFRRPDLGHLWLAYGAYHIDSRGASFYDRTLHYWIAEAVVEGRAIWDPLLGFYLGLRGHGLSTYDPDRGYLLDFRYAGTLGYNMQSLDMLTSVVGWHLTPWLDLRLEYNRVWIDLVRGAPVSVRRAARRADTFAIELGAHF